MSDKVIKSSTTTIQVGATKADGRLELTESDLILFRTTKSWVLVHIN